MLRWLLMAESIVLGLAIMLAVPVWALVPMFFGVTEYTPASEARRVYILLLAFPVVTIISLLLAWKVGDQSGMRGLYMALPIVHLVVLYLLRVKS